MLRLKRLYIDLGAALGVPLVLSVLAPGQNNQAASRTATVMGTVTDVNGDVIPNATVVLREVESNDPRTIVATESGMSLRATVFHNALVCILSGRSHHQRRVRNPRGRKVGADSKSVGWQGSLAET
jgi:hypothetical protein